MKVQLVVASGAHEGKVIPITGSQFFIGRDAQCHLRPASQAISKRHCGLLVRDGKVYVKDYGSTNGTTVNDQLVKDGELLVEDGTTLKLGPLDFVIRIEKLAPPADGTPLPETSGALKAVQAVANTAAPARDATPDPARATKPGSREGQSGSKESKPLATPKAGNAPEDEHEKIAAMLLGMDDDSPSIPDGSTVIDAPAVDSQGKPVSAEASKSGEKTEKKGSTSREEMTNAASDALRRMMRRPK